MEQPQNEAELRAKVKEVMKGSSLSQAQISIMEDSLAHNHELMKQLAEM